MLQVIYITASVVNDVNVDDKLIIIEYELICFLLLSRV